MSSDFDSRLRDARRSLPDPEPDVTRRVREAVVGSVARRKPRVRSLFAVVAALAVATAIGFSFGQRLGPEQVQAAQPRGLFGAGFLPADGWSTFQTAGGERAIALAANVPLRADDLARGSGVLPRATLSALPRGGVVIVAVLESTGELHAPPRTLPLRLADAEPELRTVAGRPLLVRSLRSRAGALQLDVTVFFGAPTPSAALVTRAERQLRRLVVEAPQVTIRVRLYRDPGTRTRELDITGTIASGAAGETVDVQLKECGPNYRFYRVVAGATTVEGGGWRFETNAPPRYISLPINAYFRARWRGSLSEPVLVRVPISASASWNARRRLARITVDTWLSGQNLRGRVVELQRKLEGTDQWTRVRRARLGRVVRNGYPGGYVYVARFSVPTRGLTLRAFVPDATGAPCFSSGFSAPFGS